MCAIACHRFCGSGWRLTLPCLSLGTGVNARRPSYARQSLSLCSREEWWQASDPFLPGERGRRQPGAQAPACSTQQREGPPAPQQLLNSPAVRPRFCPTTRFCPTLLPHASAHHKPYELRSPAVPLFTDVLPHQASSSPPGEPFWWDPLLARGAARWVGVVPRAPKNPLSALTSDGAHPLHLRRAPRR